MHVARSSVFIAVLLTILLVQESRAEVTVVLKSGREFTGEISDRTDEATLWLRFARGLAKIERPIDWNTVVTAQKGDTPISVDELRQQALNPAPATAEPSDDTEQLPAPANETDDGQPLIAESVYLAEETSVEHLIPIPPRVKTVDFDARLANWDADAMTDGLVLHLFPIDAYGQAVPANGTAHVELKALKAVDFNHVPRSRGLAPRRLARWTCSIRAEHFGPDGVVLRLPFQSIRPEIEENILSHGVVHVRLVVPGHGVFEHSEDGIRIRTFSPYRDYQTLRQPRAR